MVSAQEWAAGDADAGEGEVEASPTDATAEEAAGATEEAAEEALAEEVAIEADLDPIQDAADAEAADRAAGRPRTRVATRPPRATRSRPATADRGRAPVRTCVGCGRRAPQSELVRLARAPDHGILVSRTAPGRGAWLCAGSVSCLDRAVKRDALRRALRGPVAPSGVAAVRDSFVGPPQNMEESSAAGDSPGARA